MSATIPATTLTKHKIAENEPNQATQPHANGNNGAVRLPTKNNNGLYSKKTRLTEPRKSEHGKGVSAEEYLRFYAKHPDFTYEWNNGILEEKPVSTIAQIRLYLWFLQLLSFYLEVNRQAKAAVFEFLAEMQAGDKLIKRKPDLFIVRNDNPHPLHEEDESYAGVCDLCVELLSTSNQANIDRDIKDKKTEYEAAGVREYLILDRDDDYMEFYRLNANGKYEAVEPDADGIVTFESLPGFQFRWTDLLERPVLRVLVEDPVYNRYVLPEYEMLKRRAEQAEQQAAQELRRADQAVQRADQESQRAETFAAYLRSLGIDPESLSTSPH